VHTVDHSVNKYSAVLAEYSQSLNFINCKLILNLKPFYHMRLTQYKVKNTRFTPIKLLDSFWRMHSITAVKGGHVEHFNMCSTWPMMKLIVTKSVRWLNLH